MQKKYRQNDTTLSKQTGQIIDLLASGEELPEELIESMQAWLIDGEHGELKESTLKKRFYAGLDNAGSTKYADRMWPDIAAKLGMDPALNALNNTGPGKSLPHLSGFRKLVRVASIAAAVVLLLLGGVTLFKNKPLTTDPPVVVSADVVVEPESDSRLVTLPDGSVIKVGKNTKLTYADNFRENRKVVIDGEAFFSVVRDEQHPFTVESGGVRITVLGTEFNVKAFIQDSVAEIVLASGSVRINSGEQTVLLQPQERALIRRTENTINIDQIGEGEILRMRGINLSFDGDSLDDAFRMIGQYFGVRVVVTAPVPEITGIVLNLDDDAGLKDALFFLQVVNPVFEYSIGDGEVVITPKK